MPSCDACATDCKGNPQEHEKELISNVDILESKKERLEREINELKKQKEQILAGIMDATKELAKILHH